MVSAIVGHTKNNVTQQRCTMLHHFLLFLYNQSLRQFTKERLFSYICITRRPRQAGLRTYLIHACSLGCYRFQLRLFDLYTIYKRSITTVRHRILVTTTTMDDLSASGIETKSDSLRSLDGRHIPFVCSDPVLTETISLPGSLVKGDRRGEFIHGRFLQALLIRDGPSEK